MEKKSNFIIIGLLIAFVLGILMFYHEDQAQSVTSEEKFALDRIIASKEIKCGYLVYSPYIRRDPNTGQLSGIFYDLMEQIGKNAQLKINWFEEVGYENIFPGLQNNRFDVFCGGLWPNSTRAQAALFSVPAFYSVITAWVRKDSDLTSLQDLQENKDIKIATIDGAMEDLIARSDYPDLARVSLPELSQFDQNLQNIVARKADITFAEPSLVLEFMGKNPAVLRALDQGHPLRIFGNALVVKKGELGTKAFLDSAVQEVVYSGQMDKILTKYEAAPGSFPRVAKPYER